MMRKLITSTAAVLLTALLGAPASAALITGNLGFSDGLPASSLGNIVSDMTFFDPGVPTIASGGNGDFLGVSGLTVTGPIDLNSPGGVIYQVGGFTFTLRLTTVSAVSPLACTFGLCRDEISIGIEGTVSAAGFDDTRFLGNFTANGTCQESAPDTGTCAQGTKSARWSSTVAARGIPPGVVPVPGTLALLGLGLAGFGVSRRKRATHR